MGFASGGAILVGNELGAGALDTGKEYGGKVVKLALISGAISCGVLIMLTPLFALFYSMLTSYWTVCKTLEKMV